MNRHLLGMFLSSNIFEILVTIKDNLQENARINNGKDSKRTTSKEH